MANNKHDNVLRSIKVGVRFPLRRLLGSQALRVNHRRVPYFILIVLPYLIQLLHILTWRGQRKIVWESMAEAGKTKIIDCFQTPAGSRITNQNSSRGCFKLVFLQILLPQNQTKKNVNGEIHFELDSSVPFLCVLTPTVIVRKPANGQ